MSIPRVAISMGDPSGIGPEVVAKALASSRGLAALLFGDPGVLARAAASPVKLPVVEPGAPLPRGGAVVAVTRLSATASRPGRPSAAGARAQLAYLEAALGAVLRGEADALCTAPVSKAQVARLLPSFVGHTEWLEERTGARRAVMMLAGRRLRVALVTNHLALSRVPRAARMARVAETLVVTARALHEDFGLVRPRLALCALNPHAGEGGAFGDEEARVLLPALARARRAGVDAQGPFPADSLFGRLAAGAGRGASATFDAVVALYHDQGLIPVKLLDAVTGDAAVNVTLGLPIVRTSPDHGVAYDIAGRGVAGERSMVAALALAARLARVRRGA